jgi:hypothetical protein
MGMGLVLARAPAIYPIPTPTLPLKGRERSGENTALPLPCAAPFHLGVDGVEDLPLVEGPQGGEEAVAGAIAGEAVDDRRRVEALKDIAGEGDVGVLIEDGDFAALVGVAEFGATEDVKEVELDAVEAEAGHGVGGGEDLGAAFAGEAEDEVGADAQAALLCPCQGVEEALVVVATAQALQGGVVARLYADLQPEVSVSGVVGEEVENIIGEAVRAGTDGETDDAVHSEGFVVKTAQLVNRRVGIGEGLKIGDELLGFVLALHDLFARLQLGGDTQAMVEADRP